MSNNKTSKRKDYGVYVNELPVHVAKTLEVRVTDVLIQLVNNNYKDLDDQAEQLYMVKTQQQAQRSLFVGEKPATVSGMRFHLLCSSKGAMFMAYQAQHINSDVKVCLEHGTPVFFFSPYKVPDLVCVSSMIEWNELVKAEAETNKQFHLASEYAAFCKDTQAELIAVLNTPIPWIHKDWRLHSMMKQHGGFDKFMDYIQIRISEIEEQGEYDIELTTSTVMKEKMTSATYVATSGMKKGLRQFWCTDNPDAVEYWVNYEVLPADILRKFLHLSYLEAIGYTPLQRMYTDGVDISGKELWFGDAQEDMLRTTPIYVDTQSAHERKGFNVTPEIKKALNVVSISALKAMSYTDAKKTLLALTR